MVVLLINTNDKGGAATACIRIHEELLRQGVKSRILFLNKTREDIPHAYYFNKKLSIFKRIEIKLKTLFSKSIDIKKMFNVEWFSYPYSKYDVTNHFLYKEAEVIQFNWVSGFLDETSFFRKNDKPIVWRMPDLYCCGGGYHYEKDVPFQQLTNVLSKNSKIRQKALKNATIHFVPISKWVFDKAQKSHLIQDFPKTIIHNGLDFSIFKPLDKQKARELLSLPMDKKIVLLGADQIKTKRKGFNEALKALEMIGRKDIQPVIFGKTKEELPTYLINLGYINNIEKLIQVYSAADIFLMPSLEEAFGQVTIEALSCGIPVVSFPNGGSLDIINNGMNGELAEDFSFEALFKALSKALLTTYNSEMIIKDVKTRFDISNKVCEYIDLYKAILYER